MRSGWLKYNHILGATLTLNPRTAINCNGKSLNRHIVVDLIRFSTEQVSRVQIARQMELSRAAITAIVDDLLKSGIVRETEARYPAGRKPIGLEINPNRGRVIGVDLGASHLEVILADFAGRLIAEKEIAYKPENGPEDCLDRIEEITRTLITESGFETKDVYALGMGVPGPVTSEKGQVTNPPILPGWDGFPLTAELTRRTGWPATLNNDAELGALGEWAFGAGRRENNLVYIKVGTGVGSGLLLNGQLYGGVAGSAGEIGHITLVENGPLCVCGNRGCLEVYASGRAIAQRADQAVRQGMSTVLSDIKNSSISAKDVLSAARFGDRLAQQIIYEAGSHLGVAVANIVNLLNPNMVVLGGGVSQIGDLFLEPIRTAVERRSLRVVSKGVRITSALLGRRSSAIGAVVQALTLALHNLLEVVK